MCDSITNRRFVKKGFTLIELLVVIAIIALLLSILMPSLGKAKALAKRVVCSSNLHQYSVALNCYSADNTGKNMETVYTAAWGTGRHPEIMLANEPGQGNMWLSGVDDKYWNLNRINPYIEAFDPDKKRSKGIYYCPAVGERFYDEVLNEHWEVNELVQPPYTYYAGVDSWDNSFLMNGAENDLATFHATGGSRRIIMTDMLFGATTDGLYRYNHGKKRWSSNYIPHNPELYGGFCDPGPGPDISGLNELFTDGGVNWKIASQMDVENMGYPPRDEYCDGYVLAGVRYFFY